MLKQLNPDLQVPSLNQMKNFKLPGFVPPTKVGLPLLYGVIYTFTYSSSLHKEFLSTWIYHLQLYNKYLPIQAHVVSWQDIQLWLVKISRKLLIMLKFEWIWCLGDYIMLDGTIMNFQVQWLISMELAMSLLVTLSL